MTPRYLLLVTMLAAACRIAPGAPAFDPLFLVASASGDCRVMAPGADKAIALQSNRAYLYGSRLSTGSDGEVVFRFGETSECHVGPDTVVDVCADSSQEKWKQVRVVRGRVTVLLPEDYQEDHPDNKVTVETAGVILEPTTGGEYQVAVTESADLIVTAAHCLRGEMRAFDNELFEIPALRNDFRAEFATTPDKGFLRYRDIRGKQLVELRNLTGDDGMPRFIEAQPNSVLKMWREKTKLSEKLVVTILVVGPDGALSESIHYTVDL